MCEPLWDEYLLLGLTVELVAGPLAKGRGPGANVHSHVKNFPCQNLNQFGLAVGVLIVKSSERTANRVRQVVLNKGYMDTEFAVLFLMKGFHEEAALVSEHIGLDDEDVFQGGLTNFHLKTVKVVEIVETVKGVDIRTTEVRDQNQNLRASEVRCQRSEAQNSKAFNSRL